ncbi:MAG TPA: hypothetical protein VM841_03350 [Actinomycetota bacterium]|nr:hypothetical protein [Actinomycetota bacterium]
MLGERIGDTIGEVTGLRVLEPVEGQPRIEASYRANGTILGVHVTDMGTFESVARPDGTLFGRGHGVMMTEEGELLTWSGDGVGTPKGGPGAVAWRGAIYVKTTSDKLARLNGVAVLFEFDTDESNKVESTLHEWK